MNSIVLGTLVLFFVCGAFSKDVFENKAVNNNFENYMKKVSCSKVLPKNMDAGLPEKNWSPVLISIPSQKLKYGIAFKNSKTAMSYKIWGDKKTVHFEVLNKNTKQLKTTKLVAGTCEPVVSTAVYAENKNSKLTTDTNVFDDQDLFAVMKKSKWGVIYVWSPYMPYSVQGIAEIKSAVESSGGSLEILLDQNASLTEAEKWIEKGLVTKQYLKKVVSAEIYDRGLGVHYPAAYIYKDGFLSNADYVGFKKSKMYSKWIKTELENIDKDLK